MTDKQKLELAMEKAGQYAKNFREMNELLVALDDAKGNDFRYGLSIAFEIVEEMLADLIEGNLPASVIAFEADVLSDLADLRSKAPTVSPIPKS